MSLALLLAIFFTAAAVTVVAFLASEFLGWTWAWYVGITLVALSIAGGVTLVLVCLWTEALH